MVRWGMWEKGTIEGLPLGATVKGKVGVGRHPGFVGHAVVGGVDKVLGTPYAFRWRPGIGQERLAYYRSSNPRTSTQQNWRFIFAEAIAAWKALSDAEKREWNKKATRQGKRGIDIFCSHFLKWRKNEGSPVEVSTTRVGGLDYITT